MNTKKKIAFNIQQFASSKLICLDRLKDILDQFKKKNILKSDESTSKEVNNLFTNLWGGTITAVIPVGNSQPTYTTLANIKIYSQTKSINIYSNCNGHTYSAIYTINRDKISYSETELIIVSYGFNCSTVTSITQFQFRNKNGIILDTLAYNLHAMYQNKPVYVTITYN